MSGPPVSVVVPTFNRAHTLPRALDSVVTQTFGDWELILIDDGSTDDTPRIAEAYSVKLGTRFVYRRQRNRGCCHARNQGIDLARGAYVAFLDSDDAFAPTKLARQLELFDRRPALGLVFSDYACVDLNERRIDSALAHFYPQVRAIETTEVAPRLHVFIRPLFESLLRGYFIATIVGLVRREALAHDLRFAEQVPYAHEWLFYLQILKRSRAGYVDEPLSVHYYTPESITRSNAERNIRCLHALVTAMPTALAPLRPRERRIVAGHVADACRRLGSLACRRCDYADAQRWFAGALRRAPNPRNLYDLVDVSLRRLRRVAAGSTPADSV